MSFQIGGAERRQPAEFLSIGDLVPVTKCRGTRFEFKTRHHAKTNAEEDASELALTNTGRIQICVLTLSTIVDSPPVFRDRRRVTIRNRLPRSTYSVGCTAGVAVPVSEGLIVFLSPGITFGYRFAFCDSRYCSSAVFV